jgi:threonine dehydrogenase-like Zn-dependent dehydrogenase
VYAFEDGKASSGGVFLKAVYITEHGDLDKLTYGELPDPMPSENEVVVRLNACGVNYIDVWVRRGLPFLRIPYPFTLGQEVGGEVDHSGRDCQPTAEDSGQLPVEAPCRQAAHLLTCLIGQWSKLNEHVGRHDYLRPCSMSMAIKTHDECSKIFVS